MPTPTGNSQALFYLDTSAFGGAVQGNSNGFTWHVVGVFREPTTGRRDVIGDITTDVLDSDNLVNIRDKIISSIKAKGLEYGYNITNVIFFPLTSMSV